MKEKTLDEILDGRLKLYQKKNGYRFSLDSLLLAYFASFKKNTKVIELGCGSGIITLISAIRFAHVHFMGLEIQDDLVTIAKENVVLNSLEKNIEIVKGDASKIENYFSPCSFDYVIFNPPYRKLRSGRINPDSEKAIARHEIKGSLSIFLKASKYLLKHSGRVFIIYPSKRLVELIYRLRDIGIEPKRMKLVFSDCFSSAEFVLIEARNKSHEELLTEPPLFIYNKKRIYTEEMQIIFRELAEIQYGGGG